MSGIAIIGYGSLIWDLDDLAPKIRGTWQIASGPQIPLEFARVSDKRQQALVVVVETDHGVGCRTSYIESKRSSLMQAVDDLAARERSRPEHIGRCDRDGAHETPGAGAAGEIVHDWLKTTDYDGAVWTNLPNNFAERTGQDFSIPAAKTYLQRLTGHSRREAKRYIHSAPAAIVTPLRQALDVEPWWLDIRY